MTREQALSKAWELFGEALIQEQADKGQLTQIKQLKREVTDLIDEIFDREERLSGETRPRNKA